MTAKTKPISTEEVLSHFPEVELPVIFSDETLNVFSVENAPIPNRIVQTLFAEWEGGFDEFTEVVPCARIESTDDYHAIVYWVGGLMKYEFVLLTLEAKSEMPNVISRKPIASTIQEGDTIKKSVAHIDSDMIIHIIAGANMVDEEYNADQSQAFTMEIQQTGDIMFSFAD